MKVKIDLTAWSYSAPCGAVVYENDEVIDSEYCDDVEEFKMFLKKHKDSIDVTTDLVFEIKATDVVYVSETVKEINDYFETLV